MPRIRHSDLVLELAELCNDLVKDLRQRLGYYRVSAYKTDAAQQVNARVDQLRAVFQVLGDDVLNEAMADHDALLVQGAQHLTAGECTLTLRVSVLIRQMEPALAALVRRSHQQVNSPLREDTLKVLQRHRQTLMKVCPEGSRSREILREL
jgi:hypothetical protein